MADGPALPSLADIDAVLAFLPHLERPAPRWSPLRGDAPEVQNFQLALHRHHFLIPFDTFAWRAEAERYRDDPDALARASLLDLCKLLTFHCRAARFVNGHFAAMVESGHITAVLRRLRALRDAAGGPA